MATVDTKLLTAEEFFEWANRPENRGKNFELERGEILEMPPAGKFHGFVCCNVARILGIFAVQRKKGYPCSNDSGMIVEEAPDTVRGPDVSFYEDDQTADNMERKYAARPPKLVVEVLSPNDQRGKTDRRIKQYLKRGVALVWVVDPEVRTISVNRPGKEFHVIDDTEELTGEDVLPDFRCKAAEFFDLPGK